MVFSFINTSFEQQYNRNVTVVLLLYFKELTLYQPLEILLGIIPSKH